MRPAASSSSTSATFTALQRLDLRGVKRCMCDSSSIRLS
jgi:hypothetical protein